MSLYLALWRVALQDALQYRVESIIWFLFDVLPPIMMVFLWLTAYEGQASVAGYSLESMLHYTLGVMVLRNVITAHVEWDIAHQIRLGTLSMHLVRPFNPWALWFMSGLAARAVRGLLVLPVLLVCLAWLGSYLQAPDLEPSRVAPIVASLALAYLLSFCMKLVIGFLGFWLTDIVGIVSVTEVIAWIFGGMLLPLELLPGPLRGVADALPFQYIYYFPLSLVLGRLDGADLGAALVVQAAWAAGLAALAWVTWQRGLRRYEAVGG